MTRIYSPVEIPLPVETVYEFATTPGNWPLWHPSSLGVNGAIDHSLEVGEQVTEQFLVAGRRGQTTWLVTERVYPDKWVIETLVGEGRGKGRVIYTVSARNNGTFFEREFVYTMGNLLFKILNLLVFRRRVEAESKQAVQQLREVLLRSQGETKKEAI